MTILSKLAGGIAATALSLSVLTPVAFADRSDRRYQNSEIDRSNRAERRAERRNANRTTRSETRFDTRGNRGGHHADRGNRADQGQRGERGTRGNYGGGEYGNTRQGERRAERRQENRVEHRVERRQANRIENRQIRRNAYTRGYRDARQNVPRHSGFRYHQPRRVYHSRPQHYRPYYSRPSHARIVYGRYHRPHSHYTPRYRIGGYYGYHNHSILINDYWAYGLYDPPYGYHWVRDHDTGDAILASIATGAIIGLIIGALS